MSEDIRAKEIAVGASFKTFHTATTGAWQAITIPAGFERVMFSSVQVHDGDDSVFTQKDHPVQFWISSESDGTGAVYGVSFEPGLGKKEGEILCYIKAAVSQFIAVALLG